MLLTNLFRLHQITPSDIRSLGALGSWTLDLYARMPYAMPWRSFEQVLYHYLDMLVYKLSCVHISPEFGSPGVPR